MTKKLKDLISMSVIREASDNDYDIQRFGMSPSSTDPDDSPATQQAHKLGLVSGGWGRWKDPKTGQTVAKTVQGKLVRVASGDHPASGLDQTQNTDLEMSDDELDVFNTQHSIRQNVTDLTGAYDELGDAVRGAEIPRGYNKALQKFMKSFEKSGPNTQENMYNVFQGVLNVAKRSDSSVADLDDQGAEQLADYYTQLVTNKNAEKLDDLSAGRRDVIVAAQKEIKKRALSAINDIRNSPELPKSRLSKLKDKIFGRPTDVSHDDDDDRYANGPNNPTEDDYGHFRADEGFNFHKSVNKFRFIK